MIVPFLFESVCFGALKEFGGVWRLSEHGLGGGKE